MKNSIHYHGVMVAIQQLGILICGPAGCGKSELALGLLDRGHQLVADDVVLFELDHEHAIIGSCPRELYGWLSVRGLGLLHVEQLWGKHALVKQQRLDLVIELTNHHVSDQTLMIEPRYTTILATAFATVELTTGVNRQLPLLVEVMIKSYINNKNSFTSNDFFNQCAATAQNLS